MGLVTFVWGPGLGWSRGDTSRLNPSSFSRFFTVIAAAKDGGVVYLEDDPASKRVLCNFSGAKCFSLQEGVCPAEKFWWSKLLNVNHMSCLFILPKNRCMVGLEIDQTKLDIFPFPP